ncbi:TPA: homocysteine S-methyltransferase family protein [Vibrio alginolyticus]
MKALESLSNIVAVGLNCTPPKYINSLIKRIKSVTNKPIFV